MNASGRTHALRRSRRIGSPSCDCSSGRVTRSAGYLRAIGDPRKVRSWIVSSRNDDCRLFFASRSGTAWHLAPTSRRGPWVEVTHRELQPRDIAGASRSHLLYPCLSVAFILWPLSVAFIRGSHPCRWPGSPLATMSASERTNGTDIVPARRLPTRRVKAAWTCNGAVGLLHHDDMQRQNVVSREYKVMLRPDRFSGDGSRALKIATEFWREFATRSGRHALGAAGAFQPAKRRRFI